jgi:hypothetical protein
LEAAVGWTQSTTRKDYFVIKLIEIMNNFLLALRNFMFYFLLTL